MSAPADASGTQIYWIDGVPFLGLKKASTNTSALTYWLDGQPVEALFFEGGTFTGSITSNTRILAVQTQTINSNTTIQGTTVRTILSDTQVVQTFANNINSDADIQGTTVRDIFSNTAIQGTTIQTILSDTRIVNTFTNNILSNAHILAIQTQNVNSDADIQGTTVRTILSDTLVTSTSTETIDSNTAIQGTTVRTVNSNAAVSIAYQYEIASQCIVVTPLILNCEVLFTKQTVKDKRFEVEVIQVTPGVPFNVAILNVGSGDSVRIEWDGTAPFFNVYRVDPGPTYVKVNPYLISDHFYVIGGLQESTAYTFVVRGANGQG